MLFKITSCSQKYTVYNNDLAELVPNKFIYQNFLSSSAVTNSFSSFLHLMWSPSRTPSFITASKQRRNRTNLRKTTHQIQFPKQCILKFWTMRSKSCQLPFVTSVQLVEAGTASFTRTFSWKEVLGTRNRSDPDSTSITRRNVNLLKNPPAWPHIKYSFHLPRIRNKQ